MLKYYVLAIGLIVLLWANDRLSDDCKNVKINSQKEIAKQDSLLKKIDDLEKKVTILNRYLIEKHLEYIDACNLKSN